MGNDLKDKLAHEAKRPPINSMAKTRKKILDMIPEIQRAVPNHIKPERIARIALTCLRRTPKLLACTAGSLLGAVMTAAQLGLEPGNTLGLCHLVPYKEECVLQIGYQGHVTLAYNSGKIKSLNYGVVKENDSFTYEFGMNEKLVHVPAAQDRGETTYFYAYAFTITGGFIFEVMTNEEVEQHRDQFSKAYNSAIRYNKKDNTWITNYEAMGKKTVVLQLQKKLPKSAEVIAAIAADGTANTLSDGALEETFFEYDIEVDQDTGETTNKPKNEAWMKEQAAKEKKAKAEKKGLDNDIPDPDPKPNKSEETTPTQVMGTAFDFWQVAGGDIKGFEDYAQRQAQAKVEDFTLEDAECVLNRIKSEKDLAATIGLYTEDKKETE